MENQLYGIKKNFTLGRKAEMASLTDNMNNILQLQDVELTNAISQMRNSPGGLTNQLSKRKQDLLKTVTDEHSDTFQRVYGDMTRSSDNTNNILFYHIRNKDLNEIQKKWLEQAKDQATGTRQGAQTNKRQFEINEWSVGNKQDSLFFLQLLFICLTLVVPLLQLNRIGVIPNMAYQGITSIIAIAVIGTLLVRYQYTKQSRNLHFWNRRRFGTMGANVNASMTCPNLEELQAQAQAAPTAILASIDSGLQKASNAVDKAQAAAASAASVIQA